MKSSNCLNNLLLSFFLDSLYSQNKQLLAGKKVKDFSLRSFGHHKTVHLFLTKF